ncbi:MAG: AAA family ATPase [Acidobacteria bacterium]|nr:AAA family ATPase [Acidobacteriota bacterium]
MHITKIELEDIKSHTKFSQEFQRGTTAIVGENGAGKTTLIEAIAWTLFDLTSYKKDLFVRRGAKKGVARVTFESSFDERRYQVYRDTGTGYHVYDPELKIRIADKKEEVARFLWQHLGVEPGTDLEVLFRTAIGVPQGTFTAVFLDTETNRKKAFDKLLKVDDYRFGADKLRETSRFVELRIADVRENIARAEGALSRFEIVEAELNQFQTQAEAFANTVSEVEKEVETRAATVREFDANEARLIALKTESDRLENAGSRAEFILGQREIELAVAKSAAERVRAVEADHLAHQKALGMLRELDRERVERDKLRQGIATIETAKANVIASQNRIKEDLARIAKARETIVELKPQAEEEVKFDAERDRLRSEIARREPNEAAVKRLQQKVAELRERYRVQNVAVAELREKSAAAAEVPALESESNELTRKLAGFRARLDADKRFQNEIKNGLCPILSEKCLNLKPGQSLEDFVTSKFEEIEASISAGDTELRSVATRLAAAREAQRSAAKLEAQESRLNDLREEGVAVAAEMKSLEADLGDLGDLRANLAAAEERIKALGNPKARLIAAESEVAREADYRHSLTEIDKNLERLESDLRIENEMVESYKDLDSNWAESIAERDRTEAAHREFLANESAAKSVAEREKMVADARAEVETTAAALLKSAADLELAGKEYERERHQSERTALFEAEKRLAENRANFANAHGRATQLETEIEKLRLVRREMQTEFLERERLEKIYEASEFIRATLKKSAPLVARNYVYHVSLEAAQMFREITGNAERNLKWTEDYAIVLEENGYDRPFAVLSGGEQMAAALAVRLALLKQLSDIRLAFFDEPTTNMDAIRRERLAEQISLISQRKTFDQLFVISHDDTFESFADNVVILGEEEVGAV